MGVSPDRWSRWLLERRDAGNEDQRAAALDHLGAIRDRVLDAAEPLDGATLLDVGAGDGLIGLGALERVGPGGAVIFADISPALLERCRQATKELGALDRARFIQSRAEELDGLSSHSVDVITTRSVLIYVADKREAFAAFARVLRPGGRVSLFEPINGLMFPEPPGRFWGYDLDSVADLVAKVSSTFTVLEDSAFREAMMDFDDRDLARLAEGAGFDRVHVECHIDLEPGSVMRPVSFDALLGSAPNPNAPTLREAITTALDESEQQCFLAELNRAFARDACVRRMAVAYLAASTCR